MWRDLALALRALRKTPAFTAVAMVSLALGIGANTAIFSFVNAILLKRLPVTEPGRLVTFNETFQGETSGKVWRMHTVGELARRGSAFDGVFGRFPKPVSLSTGSGSEWVMAELVTGQYFRTLNVKPLLGRLLTEEDVRDAAANPVCVLSYALWQQEFAGDLSVLGRTVLLNAHAYRVLGITPRGFYGSELQQRFDLQIPATRIGDFMPAFGEGTGVDWLKSLSWLSPMARLKAGTSKIEAQRQTERLLWQIEMETNGGKPAEKQRQLVLEDGSQGFNVMRSEFGRPVFVLMAVVALVLLVACANLANLLLARAQARSREFAVRLSLGASRAALIRQLLAESLLLAVAGGTGGIAISFWITRTLLVFLNAGRSPVSALQVGPDVFVLAFCILVSFATAVLFGLAPAWQATSPALLPGLKQDMAGGGPPRRVLLRSALVVTQIALSLVIVFAAGLLSRTLAALETVDLGFEPAHVLTLNVDPAANGHSSSEVSRILENITSRARALPGVSAASLAASTPHGSMELSMNVDVPGYTPKDPSDAIADFNFVSPGYFETLGQPLLRGREFSARDDNAGPRVAIVNESFVRHFLRDRDPIGRKFRQGGGEVEIAGLVRDARDHGTRNSPAATVYMPVKQAQTSGLTILVRTAGSPQRIIPSLLAIVRGVDKHLPVFSVHTLELEVDAGLTSERILGYLSALFAGLATLLAGVGLYGVLAYSVVRRTREIGVRLAVGAQRRNVATLFARESLILLALGLLLGAPVALVSVRILKSLLFGVRTTDPFALFVSVLALAVAASLASSMPLWRATRVSPLSALRYE